MFGKRIKLFELFGFEVKVDISWTVIAVLITWSLASNVFPNFYEGLPTMTYWIMGVVGTLGFFLSIVLHELSHSLVARKFDLPIRGITLFIFGGLAEMEDEPPSPKAEFFMGIAGPIMSIILGFTFWGLYRFGLNAGISESVNGIFGYLRLLNFVLAGFNLLPAFPLDGGRVLRSALWQWRDDLKWSTRIASSIGSGFGFVLIFLGVVGIIRGGFIVGIWWILIGLFMRNASSMAYRRVLLRDSLEGDKVSRYMKVEPVTVRPEISVRDFIEDYVYKHHYKMFPVVKDNRPVGCVKTENIKSISREEWDEKRVGDIMDECSEKNTISPHADAIESLTKMHSTGESRLLVIERGELVGIITLKDLLRFFSINFDLNRGRK